MNVSERVVGDGGHRLDRFDSGRHLLLDRAGRKPASAAWEHHMANSNLRKNTLEVTEMLAPRFNCSRQPFFMAAAYGSAGQSLGTASGASVEEVEQNMLDRLKVLANTRRKDILRLQRELDELNGFMSSHQKVETIEVE